ncbi:MAG: sel1 repeat family protein [Alphaproteobacteria bacterium]|nr:sel1 repeat family protein [Alphaproteobacteria bacterium]MBO6629057.1 sel1 repeat family protein [Alphaproteobacteria bacterium]MDF1624940.1 tetratricopeptide repeat protein [Parvibaculaceae bacterium]
MYSFLTFRFRCFSSYVLGVFGVLAVLAPTTVAFADFDRGLSYYQQGDAARAAVEWKQDAENGHAMAAFLVGHMYKSGNGLEQSSGLAYPYFMQAAVAGNPAAQVQIAHYFYAGDERANIEQDYREAIGWFEKAALQLSAEAQYYLGVMHRSGQGVTRDRAEGLRWLFLAEVKAYVPAFLLLAEIHARGDGVVEDPVKAAMYLDLARRYVDPAAATPVNEKMAALNKYISADERAEGLLQADMWVRAHETNE